MTRTVVLSINTAWNLVNFRRGLIQALVAEGFRVVTIAPSDQYEVQLHALGCEVIALPMQGQGTSPWHDLRLCWRYRKLLQELRPVAFLGWTIKPNIYGSLAAHSLGIPVINNISGLGTAFMRKGWLNGLVRMLYRAALSRSRRVFFQNQDDQQLFHELGLVRQGQSALLPGSGIDLQHFQPAPRESTLGRPFRFLLIARMLRDKGVVEYVEAARALRALGLRVEFQCLGFLDVANPSAVSGAEMQAWVDEGVVNYLGSTDDVRPWISQADCVVLPSYREGTPRTLLEAAAMARPLVATDVPGCRNVVVHGSNGLLCEAKSVSGLVASMSALALQSDAEWQRMADASRARVERHFSQSIVIEAYLQALLD